MDQRDIVVDACELLAVVGTLQVNHRLVEGRQSGIQLAALHAHGGHAVQAPSDDQVIAQSLCLLEPLLIALQSGGELARLEEPGTAAQQRPRLLPLETQRRSLVEGLLRVRDDLVRRPVGVGLGELEEKLHSRRAGRTLELLLELGGVIRRKQRPHQKQQREPHAPRPHGSRPPAGSPPYGGRRRSRPRPRQRRPTPGGRPVDVDYGNAVIPVHLEKC